MILENVELPFPPSANRLWRYVKIGGVKRPILSAEARKYYETVAVIIRNYRQDVPSSASHRVDIGIMATDSRNRDIDNVAKPILDALTKARLWTDDSTVDELVLRRLPVRRGAGCVVVSVEEMMSSSKATQNNNGGGANE